MQINSSSFFASDIMISLQLLLLIKLRKLTDYWIILIESYTLYRDIRLGVNNIN